MNINRNNYEEYFLLYIDNELNAAEKKEVELFLQTNTDLQIEMDIFKNTIFQSDDIIFPDKGQLIKEEEIPAQLQEQLLLYIDNELDISSKKIIDQKIAIDKLLQQELSILQKTKLDTSAQIVFADKASLYRQEPARVVGFNFRRFAAAAVLLGVLCSAGYLLLNNREDPSVITLPVAEVKKSVPEQKKMDSGFKTNETSDPLLATADVPSSNTSVVKISDSNATAFSNNKNKSDRNPVAQPNNNINVEKNILSPRNNNDQLAVEQQKLNYPEKKQQVINEESQKNQLANTITPSKKQDVSLTDNDLTKVEDNNTLMASLSDDHTDKVMYVDEEKITRSRLGGFIKKVKRVVERNAKIKTGNLRIGGFDVALK